MDRRHLFVKRPFTKWYHKCMACKTRKMWEPMVKCVNCKMYRHSECTLSDECKQPPAGIFDSMTSLPDGIQQPYQFPYLDVSYDNGDNLGTVEKVLTPQNNSGVFNIEKWANFIKIDKSKVIDKKKKNINKNTPNIVKKTDTDQKALDTGAKASTVDEKMTNSDNNIPNTVENIIINMNKKTPNNIVKLKTIDQNPSDTDITTIERTKINDTSTSTIVDIPTTSDNKTTASVNTSTTDEKTKTTEKKTTDTDSNTPTIDVKTKNGNKNRPTTAENLTTSSKKMTDKGMNTSIFDEKSTTSDKKMVDIGVNTLILNEKSTTTAISQKPSETGAKTSTVVEKTNRPTTVEKLTATENKMANIEKKMPNKIVKPTTFNQNLTCIKINDTESKNTDVESLISDEKNMITNKKSLNEVKKSIVIDKNPLSISIQVSTRTEESVTVEKQLKVTDKRSINNDKKIPTIEEKTLKVDNKTPITEEKLMKIDKKIPTTAADRKISTSTVKKSPTTTDIRTTPTAEGKRIKPVKKISTTAEKETLTTVDEKMKNTVKNTPSTAAVKKTSIIAVKKSPTTTDIRTSITEGKRIKTVKNIPTTAEKKTLTTVDEKTTNTVKKTPTTTVKKTTINTVKKTPTTGTKTSTDKVRSDMNRASERKRTLADAEWSTLECVAFERNEYEDTTSYSGNAAMTGRNSAKEEVQPGNTLELRPCDLAESFPNTVLRRDSRIAVRPTVTVVQTNEYITESVLMNNRNEHLSPTDPENNRISSGLAMAHCPDDARPPVVAATCPTDRLVQSDLCLDARVACDEMTATVSQCVDPPERRRNTIGAVPEEAEDLSVNLAKLFPETKDIPFCGFFFGAQKSFDL